MNLRQELVEISLKWQHKYGVSPAITSAISEYDAALVVGMSDNEYSEYTQDRTAVSRGFDTIYKHTSYQINAHRPSGKLGSKITNAGKEKNYWDKLIWVLYDIQFNILEVWCWDREAYLSNFDATVRKSQEDIRHGIRLK